MKIKSASIRWLIKFSSVGIFGNRYYLPAGQILRLASGLKKLLEIICKARKRGRNK